ncbi:Vacuolar protein sorting-associated protein 41 [Elasticomyces elasticus]|nr:Vacuolar protein sorting-associated protein 41 [Elasticomyces elasticus]
MFAARSESIGGFSGMQSGKDKALQRRRCWRMAEDEREPLLGFACGHFYHLSCVLRANPDTSDEDEIERLLSQWRTTGQDDFGYSGRSVWAWVAHAHVIKNAVQGGCRHCVVPDGA